jgi:hypothetical protein
MKCERGVLCEKGAVAKKAVFSFTNIVNRKRAFSVDSSKYPGRVECCEGDVGQTIYQGMEQGAL